MARESRARKETGFGFDAAELDWLRAKPGTKWASTEPGTLAAWIADMDFPFPPAVGEALVSAVAHGDLGYPDWGREEGPLREAFARRMRERFSWTAEPGHVREVTDVIQGLQVVLDLATRPGDGVALHTPAYPPFLRTLETMGRRLVAVPVRATGRGGDADQLSATGHGWSFDPDILDDLARSEGCRVLVLVNPHNPTGRVLERGELEALAAVASRHDLLVVSDEIHADITYPPHRHIPFASLDDEAAARTVTLTSATKAFNLAGIRCAVAHLGPPEVRAAFDAAPHHLYGSVSNLSVLATLAAWGECDGWQDAVLTHLLRNRDMVAAAVAERLPGVRLVAPEGTYLAWLDFASLPVGPDPAAYLARRAGVRLSPGPEFGPGGEGFARLNFATTEALLAEVLERIGAALDAGALRGS